MSERLVYTGGTFDLLHYGHTRLLQKCRDIGKVCVSLNTDEFIEAYKGKPPVMNYAERQEVLLGLRYVDIVIPNIGGADSKPAIEQVRPNIIAVGSDWKAKDYHKQMGFTQEWLEDRGIELIYLPYTESISTSDIKARLIHE